MNHPDYINGEHIRLRPAVLTDRDPIYKVLARSELTGNLLGHPSQDHTPLLSFEQFCDDYKRHYFDDSKPESGRCFVIELGGQAIGQVNYNEIENARTELDIWMFEEKYCGHGYGSEALRLLCDYLQSRLRVQGFYIKPSASNPRAIRAYEKAGFRRTALFEKEALQEYGRKDSIDDIYMQKDIEPLDAE